MHYLNQRIQKAFSNQTKYRQKMQTSISSFKAGIKSSTSLEPCRTRLKLATMISRSACLRTKSKTQKPCSLSTNQRPQTIKRKQIQLDLTKILANTPRKAVSKLKRSIYFKVRFKPQSVLKVRKNWRSASYNKSSERNCCRKRLRRRPSQRNLQGSK